MKVSLFQRDDGYYALEHDRYLGNVHITISVHSGVSALTTEDLEDFLNAAAVVDDLESAR